MLCVKYVFILTLLIVGAAAGLWFTAIVIRWNDNMTQTPRIMPGERSFPMPAGVVPRGGEMVILKEQRDVAAKKPNPVKMSDASIAIGRERYATYCVPCHGAEGKGNPALGAPNLTDDAWLYGDSLAEIAASVRAGRSGVMPAWRERLGEENATLVAAWVYAQSRAAAGASR